MDKNKKYTWQELQILFPKTCIKLEEFILEMLKENNVHEPEEQLKLILAYTVNSGNRILYDFFDKYEYNVVLKHTKDGKIFWAVVNYTNYTNEESRQQAEIVAFNDCFLKLEEDFEIEDQEDSYHQIN